MAFAFAANVALLVLMVGGPYVRGHLRTRSLWRAFSSAAACVLGGQPLPEPGLGLPKGAREHFAKQVLADPEGWPARCEGPIRELDLPSATFILPWLKTAELDVDRAVELLQDELAHMSDLPLGVRMPDRPVRALEKLRAALARHAEAAGVVSLPQHDAIAFDHGAPDVAAARVPLYASADAELWWQGDAQRMQVLALDRRGLSYVDVGEGGMVQRRASRPTLLRTLLTPRTGWTHEWSLVWAMHPDACDGRETGCTRKAAGIAPLKVPFEGLPSPRWLASHPAGRADRSVQRAKHEVAVLAHTARGGLQVRLFDLAPATAPPSTQAEGAPPLQPHAEWPEVEASAGLLLSLEAGLIAHAGTTDGSRFLFQVPGEPARPLSTLQGQNPWVVRCGQGGAAGAFGTDERLRLFWASEDAAALRVSKPLTVPTSQVVHPEHPFRDRAIALCSGGRHPPVLVVRSADDVLAVVHCLDGTCRKAALATDVRWFDAVLAGDDVVTAYAGSGRRAQVLTRVVPLSSDAPEPVVTPDPCWEGGGGLCGLPRLLTAGPRLLVAAREGTDLRVMESSDAGRHWTPMRGLRKSAAP